MIDFHCHLDLLDDPSAAIKELEAANAYVLSVTTTPKAFPKTSRLAGNGGRIRTALGYHPQLVAERPNELSLFDRMLPETRYVGEIGLDGGKEFSHSKTKQLEIFQSILQICTGEGSKILSIHSRHAASAVLDQIEKYPNCGTPVLHWFTGNKAELEKAIKIGCWFSVGTPMLGSKKGREALRMIPRDRILTETDAPFASSNILTSLTKATKNISEIWGINSLETTSILKSNLSALVR